jgi:hypothetical protein
MNNRRTFLKQTTGLAALSAFSPSLYAGPKVAPRIRFSAIGLNHGHINSQVEAVIRGGGELVSVYAKEPDLLAAFTKRFPQAKRRLNQLQAAEIASQGIRPTRGPVRDALTLFDENVVLMHAPDKVWAALQARDWLTLFVDLREQWQHVHIVLFGHALLEKLVTPYKSITGHVYRVSNDINPHDDVALDAWLVQDLQPTKLATKPYEPLPVLGVPGWWPANAERAYYEDTQVFRPKREVVLKCHN